MNLWFLSLNFWGLGPSRSSVRVCARLLDTDASTRRCRSQAQPPGCYRSPCPGLLLTPSVPPARGRPQVLGEVSLRLPGRLMNGCAFCLKAPNHDPVCFPFFFFQQNWVYRQLLCVSSVLEAGQARCRCSHSSSLEEPGNQVSQTVHVSVGGSQGELPGREHSPVLQEGRKL